MDASRQALLTADLGLGGGPLGARRRLPHLGRKARGLLGAASPRLGLRPRLLGRLQVGAQPGGVVGRKFLALGP